MSPSLAELLYEFTPRTKISRDMLTRHQGWNAIKSRVEQLGLSMTDDEVKAV